MITQAAFIEIHREHLNEKFIKRYPDGQFVIQRRNGKTNLYVNFRRRTSGSHPVYPGAFGIEYANGNNFYFIGGQNNSFGMVTIYKTLDKFLAACKRCLVKEEAVEEFIFFYNNRNIPGFTKKVKENMRFCNKMHKTTISSRHDVLWEAWTKE